MDLGIMGKRNKDIPHMLAEKFALRRAKTEARVRHMKAYR
jgi:hypothetical protein